MTHWQIIISHGNKIKYKYTFTLQLPFSAILKWSVGLPIYFNFSSAFIHQSSKLTMENMNCYLLLLIFFLFLLCTPSVISYDYFTRVDEWPTVFCMTTRCRRQIPTEFTIHGLWPSNNVSPQPAFCSPTHPFNISLVSLSS